jgi:hypothetical protein
LSPTSYGNRDPILEFAEAITAEGGKEGYAQSRQFRPKLRTYVPVIVRGEEDKGVRFYSFGKTVYTELLSIMDDPDYGNITDEMAGRDIVVEYIPQEKSDTSFAKTMVRPKPNVSPLADSPELIKKFLTEQPDIRLVYNEPTFDELKIALERFLDPTAAVPANYESTSPKNESVDTNTSTSSTKQKSDTVKISASVKDVLDDFDAVFGTDS